MALIYRVSINPAGKENRFRIKWQNEENHTVHSFESVPGLTAEEIERMWQWPHCQLAIGEKLFRFLDGDAHYFQQALKESKEKGETLQINIDACSETVDWPFELLARNQEFLLPARLHMVRYTPGNEKAEKTTMECRPLKLLFMASSPFDVHPELGFEKEEEAVFEITKKLPIDITVEDSGSLEGLAARLTDEQYDVIHLSGHANFDKDKCPYFIMEDDTGHSRGVYTGELWQKALVNNPPQLLFISGCRTGNNAGPSIYPEASEGMAASAFARVLAKNYPVPTVLAWSYKVSDLQAICAGKTLYQDLSRGKPVHEAVQRSIAELFNQFPSHEKPAWLMLRLFSKHFRQLPLVQVGNKIKQIPLKPRQIKHIYLQKSEVKVLGDGFVGRRRQIQTGFRVLTRENKKAGVVLLGTGGLGKSCLAGKLCERFPHHTLIITHGKFNAVTLRDALYKSFIIAQDKKGDEILSHPIKMTDKLIHLCDTSFKEKNYLFVLDDFEQNLEGFDKGNPGPLLPEAAELLKVLLRHLPLKNNSARIIITSRYEFSLIKDKNDLVDDRLEKITLTSFIGAEQEKKAQHLENINKYPDQSHIPGLLLAGHGNPRLMEWIDKLVGQMTTSEVPKLLEAVKEKQEEFIRKHVIRELLNRGGEEFEQFLSWFSVYRQPVLLDGVKRVAEAAGLLNWKKYIQLGINISLIEHNQAGKSFQVTPLLRAEFLKRVTHIETCHEISFNYHRDIFGAKIPCNSIYIEELIFHALECGKVDAATQFGKGLISFLRSRLALPESKRIGAWLLSKKNPESSTVDDAALLNEIAVTANEVGNHQQAVKLFYQALSKNREEYGDSNSNTAMILNNMGTALNNLGKHSKAIECFQQAAQIYQTLHGNKYSGNAETLNNLGASWRALGKYKEAIDHYKQALKSAKNEYGDYHPEVASILNNLGLVWHEVGEYERAVSFYQQALTVIKKINKENHPIEAVTLHNFGSTRHAQGKYTIANNYYLASLSINRAVYGEIHPSVADNLNSLGLVWNDKGEYDKAENYISRSLAIFINLYGDIHPSVASILSNLGEIYRRAGRLFEAIECYQQSLSIDRDIYGEINEGVATTLNNLGLAWDALGEYGKAIDNLHQALSIDQTIFGKEHPNVATDLNNLGLVYFHQKQMGNAKNNFKKAYKILSKYLDSDHPNIKRIIKSITACQ